MAEFIHSPEAVVEPGETVPIESDYISRAQVVLALLDKGQRSRRYHLGDTLLTISATVIEQLTCETERYRKEALQDDDPYKPLWPNWEE